MQIKNFRWQWALAAPIALSMLGATLSGPALAQTGRQKYEKKEAAREQKQDIKGAQEHARLRARNAAREQRQDIKGEEEHERYMQKYGHAPGHKMTHHHAKRHNTKRHNTDRDHDNDRH
ncbi:MAG TPA: hypothetical protein VFA07_08345 [Chthonomonadaceae bacterium]|nr:hypothetical protein [Chthonomonadaceae bacterium]